MTHSDPSLADAARVFITCSCLPSVKFSEILCIVYELSEMLSYYSLIVPKIRHLCVLPVTPVIVHTALYFYLLIYICISL